MDPFSFIITLLSFVYSLALTHLLYGIARIVRHRRTVILSMSHALWILTVFLVIVLNWIALWDFRGLGQLSITAVAVAVLYAVLLYLVATFVTADVEDPDSRDLRAFHRSESVTYVGGLLAGAVIGLLLNLGALREGVDDWAQQNGLLIASFIPQAVALFRREGWINVLCAAASAGIAVILLALYYPVLG